MSLKSVALICISLGLPGAASTKAVETHREVMQTPMADDQVRIIPAVVHYCGFVNRQHVATFLRAIDPSRQEAGCPHPAAAASSTVHTTV